jgi:VirE N-terminal domain
MNISLYKGILPEVVDNVNYQTIISYITQDILGIGGTIAKIRKTQSKTQRNEIKKKLPSVTWSGQFAKRCTSGLEKYSGILCADIDDIELSYAESLKDEMQKDAHVMCAFISPSGGLKVLFTSTMDERRHLDFFNIVHKHCKQKYNVDIDKACKDVSRLCFLSLDKNALVNYKATPIFTADTKVPGNNTPKQAPSLAIHDTILPGNTFDVFAKIHEIVCKTVQPAKGTYNEYIGLYAIHANRYGLAENEALTAICSYCGWATADKQDVSVVAHQYKKYIAEYNKYNLERNAKQVVKRVELPPTPKVNFEGRKDAAYNTDIEFWLIIKNTKSNSVNIKILYDDLIMFLQANGFFKYRIDKGKYSLIRVDFTNKIIDVVNELQVKEFLIDFLKHSHSHIDESELKAVREMFRRGAKLYCGANILEGLEYYKPEFKKDTRVMAYVYFKNCFLKITKDGVEPMPYNMLDGFIWEKQIIDFNYTKVNYYDFDFNKFLIYCITGVKQSYNDLVALPDDALDKLKYFSLISSLGYMVHNYKNPTITKAVIAVDSQKRTVGESNGRSGKSLIGNSIAKMANTCGIDGKNFKFDGEFCFDRVNADTKIINFGDVGKNFDFEKLFGLITEDFVYSKKKLDSITIPFSESPKIFVSTNYTIRGDGESMKGRQQIIEVSNFFTATHQPVDVFGKMFFNDWDDADYNCFYSLFCDCIKLYLTNGLLKFPLENYDENKLIDTAGENFIEYMQDTVLEQIDFKQEYDIKLLFDNFSLIAKNIHLKQNTFTKNIEKWAHVYGFEINAHKQGKDKRDRRNGITYVTFTKPVVIEKKVDAIELI